MLDARALNRATLARQLLLSRDAMSPVAAVEHLVGMQAQAPFPPYYGLWTRLAGFEPARLADALLDREVVRIVLMRGTVHLVSAEDCLSLRAHVQPIMDRDLRTNTQYRAGIAGLDHGELAGAARAALAREPMTGKQLGEVLARRWPDRPPAALAHAARGLLALVQIPPRAVWGRSGLATYVTAESWLGREVGSEPGFGLDRLVLRYLGAFGPATVSDLQTWSGLTRLREVVEPLRPRLRTDTDERGAELFDLPDAPRPEPDTPAPVRFLPEFDNLLLSHADRTRIMSDEHRRRLLGGKNGVFPGTVLVDGFVAGTWRITRRAGTATLTVTPWRRLSAADATAVRDEGADLLSFSDPGAAHDIDVSES